MRTRRRCVPARLLQKGNQMTATELADRLSELLMLAHPPVAVSFGKDPPSANAEAVECNPQGAVTGRRPKRAGSTPSHQITPIAAWAATRTASSTLRRPPGGERPRRC